MIVSVFVRRLKHGATFQDFVREWEADEGFGVQVTRWLATAPASETVRHERIDTVIESTTLRCTYDLRTEHDFSHLPQQIDIGSPTSLLAALISG
jgi:hypothetical protein